MHPLIYLENISKTYYLQDQSLPVLKAINFELARGELAAIVGASGSGKTTLMNIIGFLDQCSSGRYIFAGQEVSSLPPNELALTRNLKIGFIFQSFFLLPRLTALQNVMLPLFYRGETGETALNKAHRVLTKMAVEHLAQHKPNQLSGGQQQRIAIARALVGEPDLILADEPTGALDSCTSQVVMDLLKKLHQEEGRTILIITHDKNISKQCARTFAMKDGCISIDA